MVLEMELRDNDPTNIWIFKNLLKICGVRKVVFKTEERQITVNTSWDLLLKSR